MKISGRIILSVAHTLGPPGEDGAPNEQKFFFFIQFDSKVPKKKVSHQLMQKKFLAIFCLLEKSVIWVSTCADLWCCNSISETLVLSRRKMNSIQWILLIVGVVTLSIEAFTPPWPSPYWNIPGDYCRQVWIFAPKMKLRFFFQSEASSNFFFCLFCCFSR